MVAVRDVDQFLQPQAAFVGDLGRELKRADERMARPPGLAVQLTQSLGAPARERQVIEFLERSSVFLPKSV